MKIELKFSMIAIFLVVSSIFISARIRVLEIRALENRTNKCLKETWNNKIAIEEMQCSINAILSAMTAPYDAGVLDTLQVYPIPIECVKDSISIVPPSETKGINR